MAGPNVMLSGDTGRLHPTEIYYATSPEGRLQAASSVTVPPGETLYLAFYMQNFMRYLNGSYIQDITPQPEFSTQIQLNYGSDSASATDMKMKLESI